MILMTNYSYINWRQALTVAHHWVKTAIRNITNMFFLGNIIIVYILVSQGLFRPLRLAV